MPSSGGSLGTNPLLHGGGDIAKLALLLKYAQTFPNFPKNFVPPWLFDPNYVPPNRASVMVISSIFLTSLMLPIVITRLVVRKCWSQQAWGSDDWWIIPGAILAVALAAFDLVGVYAAGAGKHSYDLTYDQIALAYKLTVGVVLCYFWSTFCIKTSILCVYLRIFPPGSNFYRTFAVYLRAMLLIIAIVMTLLFIFAFRPINALWDLDTFLRPHSSIDLEALLTASSAIYAVQDIIILILPIPVIWKVQLPKHKKISVLILFGLGGITCVVCVMRTVIIGKIAKDWDRAYNGVWVLVLSHVECNGGIICACLPALSGFVRMLLIKYHIISSAGTGKVYSSTPHHSTRRRSDRKSPTLVQSPAAAQEFDAFYFQESDSTIEPANGPALAACERVDTGQSRAEESIEMQPRQYLSHEKDPQSRIVLHDV